MNDKKHFVYLGCSGFPYGLAEVKKMTLVSKGLVLAGHSVTIICERGVHQYVDHSDMKAVGSYENINYVYTSGTPFRNTNFIKRNTLKIKGIINEISFLYKLKKNKKLDYAILSTHDFTAIVYYFTVSKLFGFKTILNHVEYFSGGKIKWPKLMEWFNNQLYDKYAPKLVNISFPISEFLINHLKNVSPRTQYLKIPILTEFEKYDNTQILQEPKYFLFSGAAAYTEIVFFIIDSFAKLNDYSSHLYLAIKGEKSDLQKIQKYIDQSIQSKKIKLFSTLNEKQLYDFYKNAIALLIPLRPIIQDQARFPHKIGEYLASGNPVIATNFGEVKYYFNDKENMLIAERYDKDLFAQKMRYVLDFPSEAKKIGENGKIVALNNFDHKKYGRIITDFLNKIEQKKFTTVL